MSYTITKEGDIVAVRFRSGADFESLQRAITESDLMVASPLQIWDLSARGFSITSNQVRLLAEMAKSKTNQPLKTAIVVNDDLSYGLSRMYSVHRQQPDNETRVFTSEEAARTWLLG